LFLINKSINFSEYYIAKRSNQLRNILKSGIVQFHIIELLLLYVFLLISIKNNWKKN